MYKAFLNDTLIYDPSGQILLGSSQLKQAKNEIGSFAFTIYDDNPGYALTSETLTGIVTVKQDEKIIYKGRIIRTYQMNPGELEVETEELTAYLRDTIQRPAEYHNMTVWGYLGQLLAVHNSQVEPEKQILLGAVTMQDAGSNLYRYTNDETTWDCIQSDLIDSLGGILRIRYENGLQYLDYLRDYPRVTDQKIEFGENLLEFSKSGSVDDLATVCIPRGQKLEESPIEALEMRLDIASVNNGLDYVQIPEAVSRYGVIQKVVIWDNVTEPANLKQKAQAWLQDNQYESLMLELSAVDLADFGVQTQHLEFLDEVVCSSAPHGMAHRFPLTAISIDITDPAASVYTLGTSQKTFSGSMRKVQHNLQAQLKAVPSKDRVLKEAQDHVTAIINTMGRGGHVVFNPDSVSPEEMLIMDTDDIETAEKLWRWNLGGLGYSNNGYAGPFETAITMDGTIAGQFVAANSIAASKLSVEYRQSVESHINQAQIDAENSANDYTDEKLKNYYSATEIETKFDVLPGQISASVAEYSELFLNAATQDTAYIKTALKNYYNKSEIDSLLDIQSQSITAHVESTIEEIKVGTTNMLCHSDFSDWTFYGCTKTDVTDSDYGDCIQVVAGDEEGTSWIRGKIIPQVEPYLSGPYTLSIHAKHTLGSSAQLVSVLGTEYGTSLADDDGYVIETDTQTGTGFALYGKSFHTNEAEVTNSWGRPSWTFTGSETSYTPKIYLQPGVTYRFAKPQYEIGNKVSAWEESPEERAENYYTKDEVYNKSEVEILDDRIGTSVYSQAKGYVDGELALDRERLSSIEQAADGIATRVAAVETKFGNYSTTTEMTSLINQTASSITAQVNKKVGTSEFGTLIEQNYEHVKIAWNNISQYIQFESGAMNIYSYQNGGYTKLIGFDSDGENLYWRGNYLGKIGTNYYTGDSSKRGIEFDLDTGGAYMAWAARTSTSANYYTKLTYAQKSFGGYSAGRLYLGCIFDTNGFDMYSDGHRGVTTSGANVYLSASSDFSSYYGPFKIRNGLICAN